MNHRAFMETMGPLCELTAGDKACGEGLCWWVNDGGDWWSVWVVGDVAYTLQGGAGELIRELCDEAP